LKPIASIKNKNKKLAHRILIWLRNDLRLHDNYCFEAASKTLTENSKNSIQTEILPIFCFDPRFFTKYVETRNARKCGIIRTKFILESVLALR